MDYKKQSQHSLISTKYTTFPEIFVIFIHCLSVLQVNDRVQILPFDSFHRFA